MTRPHSSKVALITGASSGIGAVYADRLAARGYDLILVARRADRLQALSARIAEAHGVKAEPVAADLGKAEDLARIEALLSTHERLHMLVNNAGIARLGPAAQRSADDAVSQIDLNITALTRLTQAVLPPFIARKQGVIVNIASVLGIHALPVSAVYSGTKAFVLQYTRGLQQELADTGVQVQLVLPASTATELWDLSGVPLAALNQDTVMTTEHLVDAALAGLDQGETVTWPSVADTGLWDRYEAARAALLAGSQVGTPAPRYNVV
ncbi:SDR family oxidoreductase [Acidovorax sp. SUPP950]|uniref:SDR family NAD(P)-dependent oxidoreductase n=1 Tax=unclassified Acidovorax TaxID=2684926 RepID=UPI0023C45667|nr:MULTISPECIES: SDR family oxidoreductase [Comamonadaceae]WOI45332.1 SDR family oxidoreductase [Paracidovorax avenae]GKS77708.1 SDR family oxidoreductase [Acidovorax sp. SUPP950]